jgi:hypothetical protein
MFYRVAVQNLWNNQTRNASFCLLTEAITFQTNQRQFLPDDCVTLHNADDISLAI